MVDALAVDWQLFGEGEGVRVTKVEAVLGFGDDDGVGAVGGEVEVVRVVDGDVGARGFASRGVDRRERVGEVVGGVQRLRSQDGTTCCGLSPVL